MTTISAIVLVSQSCKGLVRLGGIDIKYEGKKAESLQTLYFFIIK